MSGAKRGNTKPALALFGGVETQTIRCYLKKVSTDQEFAQKEVIRKLRVTADDTKHDDLGAIIAVKVVRLISCPDRQVLQDAGQVTAEIARAHAESEFEKYRIVQDRLYQSDFDRMMDGSGEVDVTPLVEVTHGLTKKDGHDAA